MTSEAELMTIMACDHTRTAYMNEIASILYGLHLINALK